MKTKKIIGIFEPVSFPEYTKIGKVMAKIDTGAFTGALHCTKIIEIPLDKGKILQFSPFDHPEVTIKTDDFKMRRVRSSNGEGEKRYFINTTIKLKGKIYPITLSLADRSEMKWPVLIGRLFLSKNGLLVDPNLKAE